MFSSKLILYTHEIYNQILIYGILGVTLRIVTKKGRYVSFLLYSHLCDVNALNEDVILVTSWNMKVSFFSSLFYLNWRIHLQDKASKE